MKQNQFSPAVRQTGFKLSKSLQPYPKLGSYPLPVRNHNPHQNCLKLHFSTLQETCRIHKQHQTAKSHSISQNFSLNLTGQRKNCKNYRNICLGCFNGSEPIGAYPLSNPIFTARCYASAVLAVALCLCLSVRLSVTSRSTTKTAKQRITQTIPHDSPGTPVF